MTEQQNRLVLLPCLDSREMAQARASELYMSRNDATYLAETAVQAVNDGIYTCNGITVNWKDLVKNACASKQSIPAQKALPTCNGTHFAETTIQVTNETTLQAASRLTAKQERPLALNFANGVEPGGGFLRGARAQEESLCRCSALYATLKDDPMYKYHASQLDEESSDWAILSPNVPVFRTDNGTELPEPWLLSFVTCAAPYGPAVGVEKSQHLLQKRIKRVLQIAAAHGYSSLVLGAWGCGAFGLDPSSTAQDFRRALEDDFAGVFSNVVFAIADWSNNRRFLGPFRDVFAPLDTNQADHAGEGQS